MPNTWEIQLLWFKSKNKKWLLFLWKIISIHAWLCQSENFYTWATLKFILQELLYSWMQSHWPSSNFSVFATCLSSHSINYENTSIVVWDIWQISGSWYKAIVTMTQNKCQRHTLSVGRLLHDFMHGTRLIVAESFCCPDSNCASFIVFFSIKWLNSFTMKVCFPLTK